MTIYLFIVGGGGPTKQPLTTSGRGGVPVAQMNDTFPPSYTGLQSCKMLNQGCKTVLRARCGQIRDHRKNGKHGTKILFANILLL